MGGGIGRAAVLRGTTEWINYNNQCLMILSDFEKDIILILLGIPCPISYWTTSLKNKHWDSFHACLLSIKATITYCSLELAYCATLHKYHLLK